MRKWLLAGLAVTAVCLAGAAYHLFVMKRSAEHYRGLVKASTAAEKVAHYREVFRLFDPLDPSRRRARQWIAEHGPESGIWVDESGEVQEGLMVIVEWGSAKLAENFLAEIATDPGQPAAETFLVPAEVVRE